ncbi:MAG: aminotransferase class V-fold PLP-dependent enzyme [Alphaproteobacteria bacterium]|nr:aminotransferase class V-fold PLP-dependent enzyme [Alphaproteobacteria bacterium]
MAHRPGLQFLHTPGPTHIPDRVQNAMHQKAVDFASPDFMDLAVSCFDDLKPLFGTEGEVFIYTSSGHGAWEAAFVNLFEPGDVVLIPETGRFSRVWGEMAEALGLEMETIPNDWRHAIDPGAVETILRNDTEHRIRGVLVVHTETATGVTSDMQAIRRAIHAAGHPALFVVDAIASWLTTELPIDAWGVDVAIAASQKGLMLPPGLSFAAVGDKALAAAKECKTFREYWSWNARLGVEQYRRFCGTAPEQHIFGLREAIDILGEEGLDNVFHRHRRLAAAVQLAVEAWSRGGALEVNAVRPEERADSITAIRTTEGLDAEDIRRVAREVFDVACGGGLADLAGKVFRIGHMGDLNDPMVLGALGGIEAALGYLDIAHQSGLADAASHLAETAPHLIEPADKRQYV